MERSTVMKKSHYSVRGDTLSHEYVLDIIGIRAGDDASR